MLTDGLFFGATEIATMRTRVASRPWLAPALEGLRRRLEARREDLLHPLPGAGPDADAGKLFLDLAIGSQLLPGGWHREAAEGFLARTDDPGPFSFKQGFELCLALDFLPGLDPALMAKLTERVLWPVGEKFMRARIHGGNIQTTYNLTLLCVGLLTERADFVARVTEDPELGYAYQLANSINADGFWFEQCPASYHCGSIERFLRLRWLLRRHGHDALGGDLEIQRMLATLPGMALPGGVLPLIGEIGGDSTATFHKGALELAYAMYDTPWIGWALGQQPRSDLWALLVGRDLGAAAMPDAASQLFPATGLAVLRQGSAPAYWDGHGAGATVTFGPHGDWHGHAGKLGIEYRHNGDYLLRDRGHSGGYSNPIHRQWYMSTLAHSTLLLDGRSQAFSWCKGRPELGRATTGRCHAWLTGPTASACTVSADFAYPGCRVLRTLFLTPDYLLDLMECEALDDAEHQFDWLAHGGGRIVTELPFAPAGLACVATGETVPSPAGLPYAPGSMAPASYDYLREIQKLTTDADWHLDFVAAKWAADFWKLGARQLRLQMLGEPGTAVYKAVCPSAPAEVYQPVVLVRRRARRTVFMALHTPGETQLTLRCLVQAGGTLACRVDGPGRAPTLLVKRDTPEPADIAGIRVHGHLHCGPAVASPG